jgi:TPP-dependent pyruvate/acetoin dehydrogenase alpha subunit
VVGATCIGDGATSTGAFHEALNQAAVERLPLVLVVANNRYAYSTPNEHQFACLNLVDRAVGYGVEGSTVDGTDLAACLDVVGHAVDRARAGRGPQLVVASLLRLCGHAVHDTATYVDPALIKSALGRDCLKVAEEYLLQKRWLDSRTVEQWLREAQEQVDEAVATVQREPLPDPYQEKWHALSSNHLVE